MTIISIALLSIVVLALVYTYQLKGSVKPPLLLSHLTYIRVGNKCELLALVFVTDLFNFNKSPAQLSTLTQSELKLHLSTEADIT